MQCKNKGKGYWKRERKGRGGLEPRGAGMGKRGVGTEGVS